MVYGFVRQSGGRIVVESEVDRGTVFRIHLPRHIGEAASLRAPESQAIPGGSERVLVVEDDAAVRASVVRQLRSLGYDVSEADGGGAGLRAFEAAATPFDLLLTDVVMPGSTNGKALADAVAARWPGTAILFMSGYSATLLGDADSSLALLAKPFRKADLARQVRRTLEVRRGGAPELSL
jgi:CheY-like chemotaxis protein